MSLLEPPIQSAEEIVILPLRRPTWMWAMAALLVLMVGGFAATRKLALWSPTQIDKHSYVVVRPTNFEITIKQNGELEAVNNVDINCPVTGQNTIQQIVPEGSYVKKGDTIAVLDSTEHRRTLEAALIELEKSQGDVKWAREQLAIQQSSNAAALSSAQSDLELAKITLHEYSDGTFPSTKKAAERKVEMADIKVKHAESDYAATKTLFDKKFGTLSELQKSQLDVLTAKSEQEGAASELNLLAEYTHVKDLAEKQNKLLTAENKVAQVLQENAANFSQKQEDLHTKERELQLRKTTADAAQKNFDGCTMKADADGMVLYASSVNMNYFRDQPIQVGAKVFEEQMLVRLPDVSKMKAVIKVRESLVMKLRQMGEKTPATASVAIVGVAVPINGQVSKIGVLPDNSQRWLNPDAKDYPVDITLDQTPANLKPGASVQAVVYIGRIKNALAVPLAAIYSAGEDHYVFAKDSINPKPLKVKIGESNDTSVQILEGLAGGEEVMLLEAGEGRTLLDQAGIKSKPTDEKSPSAKPSTQAAPPTTALLKGKI